MNNRRFEENFPLSNITAVALDIIEVSSSKELNISAWLFSLLMEYISYAMVAVAVFGITGNILIIITYIKIGFSESINISYCAMSISDILCIACLVWNAVCFIPAFVDAELPFIARELVIPTGSATGQMFCDTTAWITAFISLERCLCVLFPLQIRMMFTPKRTTFIVSSIFLVIVVPLMGIRFTIYRFYFRFDTERNQTLLRVVYVDTAEAEMLYSFLYVYTSVCLVLAPMVITLVCSVFLAIKLRRSASWRHKAAGTAPKQSVNTAAEAGAKGEQDNRARRKFEKDMRVAKTVLVITTAFIVLGMLTVVRFLTAMVMPEFRPVGAYGKLYRLLSRLAFLFSLINASVNFTIYYTMGSKFRRTVNRLLGLKLK